MTDRSDADKAVAVERAVERVRRIRNTKVEAMLEKNGLDETEFVEWLQERLLFPEHER